MGAVTLLIIFGIAMIRSTTLTSIDPAIQQLTDRQILYTIIGAFVFFAVIAIDYRLWGALATSIYLSLVGLLLVVEASSVTTFGAARWIDLGIIQFQPSELGKFLIVLTLANLVANRAEQISQLNFVLRTLIHVGVPVALVFLQPDLSTALIYGVVWFAIMWAAGLRWQHIALFGAIMAIVLPLG